MKNKKIILLDQNKKPRNDTELSNILNGLQVPRRPNWEKAESKQALENLENEAYLNWRRELSTVEESADLSITPYEKNLEVWRQLWRVVERSDMLVQIIDGRNPLFFFSKDLFNYAREVGKKRFLLIINKSDLLPLEKREEWHQYFLKIGIDHIFFTAKEAKSEEEE